MQARFTKSFKIQAVEKVLRRSENTGIAEIADSLGVGYSTLQKWVAQSRQQEFESASDEEGFGSSGMMKEKRPQDWSMEEKLDMVIVCASLDDDAISLLCREKGLYPHHIKHWKEEIVVDTSKKEKGVKYNIALYKIA